MTELEYIEIEGFKGLESVEFEPSQINLITGRNNTGKTSLLESIDLLLNPERISRFGGNADEIINVGSEGVELQGRTSNNGIELNIEKPTINEVGKLIIQAAFDSLRFQPTLALFGNEEEDGWGSVVENAVQEVFEEELDQETEKDLQDEFLIISQEEEEYPYFIAGDRGSALISSINQQVREELSEGLDEDERKRLTPNQTKFDTFSTSEDSSVESIEIYKGMVRPTPRPTFLRTPDENSEVKFINSIDLVEGSERGEGKNVGIKKDNINDYIKENGLVDNLKTFDFDYLVFEKEDGKKHQIPYSFMGDGFKAVVGLLWELMDDEPKNDIVLIEEPENHMHPGYVRKVVRFLIDLAREEDVQLFITTHDNDFINDFFMENLTDEQREFLEEEFTLIQMEHDAAQVMDYETAEETLKDLHLDLRGL